jgi:hypothetical protein
MMDKVKQVGFLSGNVLLFLSLSCFFYWLIESRVASVYQNAVVGAIYELLWLPMIILLVALPVVSALQWIRQKFSLRSVALYAAVINLATVFALLL